MQKVIDCNSLEQYKSDMQKYSIIVNRKRSVCDVRDGLKAVHRKIIDAMYNYEHCISEGSKVKSSAIVGTAMKVSYPHGDAAIYDAMKPMANWFEIKMPLIKGEGNWGNFQGDSQAAARYTEAYLSQFALECVVSDLKDSKQTIDWIETYDGKHFEPEYFPVAVPLLLINGAFGIGIGLRCDIPKHNLSEVIDATLKLIEDPNAPVVLVPDHCMPCKIIKTDFKSISNKGNGNYKVRGIIEKEEYKGKDALVIKSTPDMVFLNNIIDKIEGLIESNKLIQVQDTIDESNEDQMRFVITLKKGADANFVRDVIYANTDMEKSYPVNFEVLDGVEPVRMSYKSYLLNFIDFRKLTKFRLYCNRLQQVQTKYHERDAYIKVLKSGEIDNIIDMIKKQTKVDDEYLVEYLIKKLDITDLQAKFILGSDIRKLSKGYLNKYIEEANELSALANDYLNRITHDELIVQEIVDELLYYKKKYGTPRMCPIVDIKEDSGIPKGEFKIIVTENNYIKKVPYNDSIGSFRGDAPKLIIKAENTENILIFDELGKVYKLAVSKIPFSDKNSNGIDVRLIIKNLTANINKVMYEPNLKFLADKIDKYFLTVVTNKGNIKKLDLEDIITAPPSGIYFIKLDDGDTVKEITTVAEVLDVIVYSDNKALRMPVSDIPHCKRNSKGLKSMNLKDGEHVDGLSVITPDTTDVVVLTESGMINRFDVVALPSLGRAKSGSKVIKLNKTDRIKSIYGVNIKDALRIITKNGKTEINVADIPVGSSISPGTKMIPMKGDVILRCDVMRNRA